jgi:hypothetical protein
MFIELFAFYGVKVLDIYSASFPAEFMFVQLLGCICIMCKWFSNNSGVWQRRICSVLNSLANALSMD